MRLVRGDGRRRRRTWWSPGWFVVSGGTLATVAHDATLTGNGTPASPLGENGGLLTRVYGPGQTATTALLGGANTISGGEISIVSPGTFGHIIVNFTVLDAGNLYDLGIYNSALQLIADIGPQTIPSTGLQAFAFTQGQVVMPSGVYYFAWTGAANTASLDHWAASTGLVYAYKPSFTATTSALGQLPAAIAQPAVSLGPTAPQITLY